MAILVIIKKRWDRRNKFNSVISRIQSLINDFISFKIYHVKRDINSLANQVAKIGANIEGGNAIINWVWGYVCIT